MIPRPPKPTRTDTLCTYTTLCRSVRQGAHMKLSSRSLPASGRIPGRCAFAGQAPIGHVRLGHNRNPQLTWRGAPATTKSFVLTMIDGDAPTRPDDVNREGRSVSARLPRAEFVHWLLVDIPPTVTEIAEGA